MTILTPQRARSCLEPVRRKLNSLGVDSDEQLDAILSRIHVRPGIRRSADILAAGTSPRHSTVLLGGVACLYERLPDGTRQIYAFQYPGTICDLNRHLLPETSLEVAVGAVTKCTIGVIRQDDLEQLIADYPSFGLALWRDAMLEASICRKTLVYATRQPALQRVAHLLCEQLARQEAAGLDTPTISLTQMDVADAAGLSVVHVNRTFKELRRLGLLSKSGRAVKVENKRKLASTARFSGTYLNMPWLLRHWQLEVAGPSTRPDRSGAAPHPLNTATGLCTRPDADRSIGLQ